MCSEIPLLGFFNLRARKFHFLKCKKSFSLRNNFEAGAKKFHFLKYKNFLILGLESFISRNIRKSFKDNVINVSRVVSWREKYKKFQGQILRLGPENALGSPIYNCLHCLCNTSAMETFVFSGFGNPLC